IRAPSNRVALRMRRQARRTPEGGTMSYTKETIDKLTDCLKTELSAVETYDIALRHVTNHQASTTLRQIRDSHDRRVTMLRDRIRAGGAEPATSAGAWGALGKLVQASADLLGERAALTTLEQGEERVMKCYSQGVERCDPETQTFVRGKLLPEQQ